MAGLFFIFKNNYSLLFISYFDKLLDNNRDF